VVGIAGTVIGAGAAIYSANQTYEQGVAQKQEYDRQAAVDELAGKNAFAASQRDAEQRKLEGKLIMSRQQAYAAASGGGGGADAPTIAKILTDTGANAEQGARSVLYGGEQAQSDYFSAAQAKRITGQNNFMGSVLSSIGTLAGGVGHLVDSTAKYFPVSSPSSAFSGSTATARAY
jgi:hypothetical protein